MKQPISRTIVAGGAAMAAVLAGLSAGGQATADTGWGGAEVPTFREFEAATVVDPQGQYLVNGDEPIATSGISAPTTGR